MYVAPVCVYLWYSLSMPRGYLAAVIEENPGHWHQLQTQTDSPYPCYTMLFEGIAEL